MPTEQKTIFADPEHCPHMTLGFCTVCLRLAEAEKEIMRLREELAKAEQMEWFDA